MRGRSCLSDTGSFFLAADRDRSYFRALRESVLPIYDINVSVNFWFDHSFGYAYMPVERGV